MTTLKVSYGTATAFTWTASNSLATTDINLLVGATTLAVANTTTLADDYIISGVITGGTAPTINTIIEISCYASADNASKYTSSSLGTDSALTIGTTGIKNLMPLVVAIQNTDATNARVFQWGPYSVANLFGGTMPDHFGLYISQNTGVALSASNPATYTAVTYTNS